MSQRKQDLARTQAEAFVDRFYVCRTAQDAAPEDVIKAIARMLRRAEKRGYQRGVKELAKVLTGRRRQERER